MNKKLQKIWTSSDPNKKEKFMNRNINQKQKRQKKCKQDYNRESTEQQKCVKSVKYG